MVRSATGSTFTIPIIAVLIAIVMACFGGHDLAAAKSARYSQFDVDMAVQTDGTFRVTETQTVAFDGGPFSTGHRKIPTARTDGIANISVAEVVDGKETPFAEVTVDKLPDASNQFSLLRAPGSVTLYWTFPSAVFESRTFVVRYDLLHAMRSYPAETPPNQQVWWTAVGAELTKETPVDASRVRITLPKAVATDSSLVVTPLEKGKTAASLTTDGQTFTWEHGAFKSGDDLTLRLQFPVVLASYAAPDWQAADDAQRASAEKSESHSAFVHLFMLAIGLLAVGGGSTGLFGLWYLRGRDPHVGLVADFLPQPPDALSPGAAGALVDEVANDCDIIATLLDLVRRGVVTMSGDNGDYRFVLEQPDGATAPHERRMLDAMFGTKREVGATTRLTDFGYGVHGSFPAYRDDLYADLVAHGYFNRSPEETRRHWRRAGWIVVMAALVAGAIGSAVLDGWVFIPAVAVAGLGLALRRVGGSMPRKTEAGAEAAAKWRAFKRYLMDIRKYEKVEESGEIFQRYLPFAIAFGVESSWVRTFSHAATRHPLRGSIGDVVTTGGGWGWGPGHPGGTVIIGGGGNSGGGGGIDIPNVDLPKMPSMQSLSNKGSSGVQSGSSGLMGVLNVAGAILEIASIFAGGGGSGGSSGGGGGGFD